MTKLLVTMIDWEYPSNDQPISSTIYDLYDRDNLIFLYITLANGIIVEMKAEGDTEEAIDVLKGMLHGAGSAEAVTLSEAKKEKLWLFEEGLECYQQGPNTSPGYIFINPTPQPNRFDKR